jgi:hypothetical protein
MITKFIEATNQEAGGLNWGKFMVCRFDEAEWQYHSAVSESRLLPTVGWTKDFLMVVDLQTGEGAIFKPRGVAAADLHKHKIWVCPMFEHFLTWLYAQDLTDLNKLPALVQLEAESAMYGYRRTGFVPASAGTKPTKRKAKAA